jgi:hypothetical protein
MRRKLGSFAVIGATLMAIVGTIGVLGAPAGAVEFPDICHSTGSSTNPYVVNHPNNQGQFEGHADHTGPIWSPGATQWGDIIPPIPDLNYPGLNWPEGQAIWENDCKPVEPPPETAPPETAPPETAPPPPPGPAAAPPAPPGPAVSAPSAPAAVAAAPRVTG